MSGGESEQVRPQALGERLEAPHRCGYEAVYSIPNKSCQYFAVQIDGSLGGSLAEVPKSEGTDGEKAQEYMRSMR